MEKEYILKVRDLAVTISQKKLLHNVSFDVRKSEVLAVIGPNGAGKSLLLKTLLGLFTPSEGSIAWAPNTKIGYLPQRFQLDYYLPMNVGEFLTLKPNAQNVKQDIKKVFDLVGLNEEWLKKKVAHLSSGQLQKILIAWSLLDKPDILLFDEPTENIDMVGQESIYKLLEKLHRHLGISLIIVSHDLHVVYRYANLVLCINNAMLCYGEPEQTLTNKKLSELYGDHTSFHHNHQPIEH